MNRHWFAIVEVNGSWTEDYWFFALLLSLALNFTLWALFIWMARSIIFT